jgi:TP901 family phage tail tape measure protein
MSNKLIRGLTIQLGAETTKLDKALKDAESRTRSACGELRQINSILKSGGDSAEMWKQKQEVLTTAIESSREKLKAMQTAQKSISDQLRDGNIDKGAYDKFKQDVEKAQNKLAKLKAEQTEIEKKFDNKEIDQEAYDKFRRKVENAEKKVKDLRIAEKGLEESVRIGDVSEDAYREFRRELERTEANVRNFSNQLGEAKSHLKVTGDEAQDTADDVKELGDNAEKVSSGGISSMTVALGNLAADGIRKAATELKNFTTDVIETGTEFDAGISKVGAISGASAEDMEKLREKAKEMGASTKFTAAESAEALEYMAMAGWKTEDMLSGISGIMDLAAASGEDLGTTSDIVTDALTAFGLTAADSGHFADVLAAASSNANTNVSMMGETFKYVAPVAGTLNYSIEDMAEAIGLMANSGIKSSQAGTALRSIITRLSTDAGSSSKSLGALGTLVEKLGVEFYDTNGKARDFGDVIAETREAWQGLTDEEQTTYGKKIAGEEAIASWLSLMNAAPADVEKLSAAIKNCDGAASDMSSTMQDNLQGDFVLLDSAVDGMKISLADELEPEMRDIVQYITKKMPDIEDDLSKVFKVGSKLVGGAVKTLPVVADILEPIAPLIAAVGVEIGMLKVAQTATGWMKGLNAVMSANPAVAVATGIFGVSAALFELYKKYDSIPSYAEGISKMYEGAYENIDNLAKSMKDMKDGFNERAGDVLNETERTKDLWEELENLADSTGRVKDSDKVRAEYILGELNDALGTEYTMTDNMIDKYKEMESEIDDLIEKKKSSLLLDEYSENIPEYQKIQKEAKDNYISFDQQAQSYKDEMKKIEAEWAAVAPTRNGKAVTIQEYVDDRSNLEYGSNTASDNHLLSIIDAYDEAQEHEKNSRTAAEGYERDWQEATAAIEKYDTAFKDFSEGNFDAVVTDLYGTQNEVYAILDDAESDLEKRKEAVKKGMADLSSELKLALSSDSQAAMDDVFESIGELYEKSQIAGVDATELMTDEMRDSIQKMLDAGFDVTKLGEWFANSGIKTSDVFNGNYVDIVQKQLDKGYDVTKLLEWGMNSGSLTGDDFWRFYDQNCQNGFSTTFGDGENSLSKGILEWARRNGIDAGELFGENYSHTVSEWTRWLYDNNNLIQKSIQSASDARLYKNGAYSMNAVGGIISNAGFGRGIVAESGPELLEIINGGVKVTPLSRTSKLTPVQDGNTQKVFYFNNTINATVSGRYDVRRIAEDLAAEQRAIETGRGMV